MECSICFGPYCDGEENLDSQNWGTPKRVVSSETVWCQAAGTGGTAGSSQARLPAPLSPETRLGPVSPKTDLVLASVSLHRERGALKRQHTQHTRFHLEASVWRIAKGIL